MSASENKTSHARHHGRSGFCCFPKPTPVHVMSESLSSPRYIKVSLPPILNSHLSTTLLLRKFQNAWSKDQCLPKRPRKQDDVLSPLCPTLQHILKLQNTNACEPKYLPAFWMSSALLPSCLFPSFYHRNSEAKSVCEDHCSQNQNKRRGRGSSWSLSFLWVGNAELVKEKCMHDFQFKSPSCLCHESAENFQKSVFQDLMCSAFRLWAKNKVPTTHASSLLRKSYLEHDLALRKSLQDP